MLVHLKQRGRRLTPALFEECIVDELRGDQCQNTDEIYVEHEINEHGMILEASSSDKKQSIPLCRPLFCPLKLLDSQTKSSIPLESKSRGVKIGVAILLESSDNCVLITRRSKTMRTFPGVWVPPGGHVEPGETLLHAGLREMAEETGIQLEQNDDASILGFWESVYPPMLQMGPPKRHHIVTYLHIKAKETASALLSKSLLAQEETDACACLCTCFTYKVAKTIGGLSSDYILSSKHCTQSPGICAKAGDRLEGISIEDGRVHKGRIISTESLLRSAHEAFDERISTGTLYALKRWLVTTAKCLKP